MMNRFPFLKAEWRELIFANYVIDPALLTAYLPAKTELDYFNGRCYVSLVAFEFREVRVRGMKFPLHSHFPEVNRKPSAKCILLDRTISCSDAEAALVFG